MKNSPDLGYAYNINLFRFSCCLCGAKQHKESLREYLGHWKESSPRRFSRLLSAFSGVIKELSGSYQKWISSDVEVAFAALKQILEKIAEDIPFNNLEEITESRDDGTINFLIDCPICEIPAGKRIEGRYSKSWNEAGKAQLGAFLYEANIIIWSLSMYFPDWISGEAAENLHLLRNGSKYTSIKAGLDECPQCGRWTTTIYGPANPEEQFCRWCLDDGMPYLEGTKLEGGIGVGFQVTMTPYGNELDILGPEPEKPAEADEDLLPPAEN